MACFERIEADDPFTTVRREGSHQSRLPGEPILAGEIHRRCEIEAVRHGFILIAPEPGRP